jgi:hypothetical protein
MYGPLEYVLFQFDDDRFIGEILPTLIEIERRGCVGLVDLVFVVTDESGEIDVLEIDDLSAEDQAAFEPLLKNFKEMLTQEDVALAAKQLPENAYAAVVLFEHRWALGLHNAVAAAGGQIVDSAYIHPQTQAEAIAELKQLEADHA